MGSERESFIRKEKMRTKNGFRERERERERFIKKERESCIEKKRTRL